MVGKAGSLRRYRIALAAALALTLVVNPSAESAGKKNLKLLWSDEFNSKKGSKIIVLQKNDVLGGPVEIFQDNGA